MRRAIGPLLRLGVLLLAGVLRFKPACYLANLEPMPDGMEYALGSLSLFERGAYVLTINGVDYPPHVAPGFAALLTPVFAILGTLPHYAYYGHLVLSVALVASVMLLARRIFGEIAALVSGFAAAISGTHIQLTNIMIMSDLAGCFFIVLSCVFALASLKDRRRESLLLVAGWAGGVAVTIHYSNVSLLAAMGLAVLILVERRVCVLFRTAFLLGLGAIIGIAPLLAYHYWTFGSPIGTGYSFWGSGQPGTVLGVFSVRYMSGIQYYMRILSGIRGQFYPAPFMIAVLVGILVGVWVEKDKRRLLAFLAVIVLGNLLFFLMYPYRQQRFVLISSIVLMLLGGYGVQVLLYRVLSACTVLFARIRKQQENNPLHTSVKLTTMALALSGSLLVVVIASLLGTGWHAVRSSYAWRVYIRSGTWWQYPWRYEIMRYLAGQIPPDAIVISGVPGPYFNFYVLRSTERVQLPIVRGMAYAQDHRGRQWDVADEQPNLIVAAIRRGTPVYVMNDPDTAQFRDAFDRLRQRFVLHERGAATFPIVGTLTLYEVKLKSD